MARTDTWQYWLRLEAMSDQYCTFKRFNPSTNHIEQPVITIDRERWDAMERPGNIVVTVRAYDG